MESNKLKLGLTGILSGIISFFVTIIPGIFVMSLYIGPGVVFGVILASYFSNFKIDTPLPSKRAIWIFVSTLAWFVAYFIVFSISWGGEWGTYNNIEILEYFKYYGSYFAAGLVGGLLMLLGFKYLIFNFSIKALFFLTLLAGILAIVTLPIPSDFGLSWAPVLIVWQAGMAFALGWVIDNYEKTYLQTSETSIT